MVENGRRREAILHEAARQFALKGIAGTTVREIADAVGVLSGSLYHHFASKDDIVHAILSEYLETLTSAYRRAVDVGTDPRSQMAALIRESLGVMGTHPYATEIYQTSGRLLSGRPKYANVKDAADLVATTWTRVIETGVAGGAFRRDMPVSVVYRLVRDSLWLSVRWFRSTAEYSTDQFADNLVSMYLDGIVPRDGQVQR